MPCDTTIHPVFTSWKRSLFFMLAPRPNPQVGPPLSSVRDCLFNIFAATLHIGGRSFIRSLRTHHAMVTGTQLSRPEDTRLKIWCLVALVKLPF